MAEHARDALINTLARLLARGPAELQHVRGALRELTSDELPYIDDELIEALEAQAGAAVERLVGELRALNRRDAIECHRLRTTGRPIPTELQARLGDLPLEAPLGWIELEATLEEARRLLTMGCDLLLVDPRRSQLPRLAAEVRSRFQDAAVASDRLWQAILPLGLLTSVEHELHDSGARPQLADEVARVRAAVESARAPGLVAIREAPKCADVRNDALSEAEVLDEIARFFDEATDRAARKRWLDVVSCWPTDRAMSVLGRLTGDDWARHRAELILRLRFGGAPIGTASLPDFIARRTAQVAQVQGELVGLVRERRMELLWIWSLARRERLSSLAAALQEWCADNIAPSTPDEFANRWADEIPDGEWQALTGVPGTAAGEPPVDVAREPPLVPAESEPTAPVEPTVPVEVTEPLEPAVTAVTAATAEPAESLQAAEPAVDGGIVPEAAPPSKRATIWRDHVRPLFIENWYMVAGLLMVVLGSSLLAYYTWDKHWLIRYTVVPGLLALFTAALAGVGRWMEGRSAEFAGTAAALRGAAIGLLPVNFMTVAILAGDTQVEQRAVAVPLMGLVYLGLAGWGLYRWCSAVCAPLGPPLGGALLLVNSLVILVPVAQTVGGIDPDRARPYLAGGFYLGFVVLAGVVVRFATRVLNREMAAEKRVPWFVGATLCLTFAQVFAWVHGTMGSLPRVFTYAPMMILAGWVVLFLERRTIEIRGEPAGRHGSESFLGFALILLGVFMGASHASVRIGTLLLAGAAWIYQARSPRHPVHYWISLTFMVLGVAAVGLLPGFPTLYLPALGIAAALGTGILGAVSSHYSARASHDSARASHDPTRASHDSAPAGWRGADELARACRGMQPCVAVLTALVAVLAQWYAKSPPLAAAGYLVGIAALLLWRGVRSAQLRWIHSAMVVLATALPYLGFVDFSEPSLGYSLQGNTMVFGLAVLSLVWLAWTRMTRQSILREARSTVLWVYGALAVTAMALRVLIEREPGIDPQWYRIAMDYSGPILMLVVLAITTYHSRSLIPAFMAVVIVAVFFPELKVRLREALETIGWGSGLGSAISGLALTLACYPLQRAKFLRNLGDGDRFFGQHLFPLRRYDHTLFTWPMLAAALFLILKVETWNFVRSFDHPGPVVKTAAALVITGLAWVSLAVLERHRPVAAVATHMGWVWLVIGYCYAYWRNVPTPDWTRLPLITVILVQTLYMACRFSLRRFGWLRPLFVLPLRRVLAGLVPVVAALCIFSLAVGVELERLRVLAGFIPLQLVWLGVWTRAKFYGFALFAMIWAVVLAAWGTFQAPSLASYGDTIFMPTLYLLVGIQVFHVAMEPLHKRIGMWQPLFRPLLFSSSLIVVPLGFFLCGETIGEARASYQELGLVFVCLTLTARAHRSGLCLLLASAIGYLMARWATLYALEDVEDRVIALAQPWKLSAFSCVLGVSACVGSWLQSRVPRLFGGPFAQKPFTQASSEWLVIPAALAAIFAALAHTVDVEWRAAAVELWAPYLGAVALVACFLTTKRLWAYPAATLFALGNVHVVRFVGGDYLRGRGLEEMHLICLGLAATFLITWIGKPLTRRSLLATSLARVSLVAAGLTLVLLSTNYLVDPNLEAISSLRFVVSGLLAYVAGLRFRSEARNPASPLERAEMWFEGLYHYGVTMAVWCAALLIPWFRHPAVALSALGVPAIYFYLRAELGFRTAPPEDDAARRSAMRYRTTAAVISFAILALYVSRSLFQMVLFPETPVRTDHYHHNAPLVFGLSIVLLRLNGLGGTSWLGFYGGLAMMVASFFCLTAVPGLGPFEHPVPAAWCIVVLAHFWTLVSSRRSPVGTIICQLAAIDVATWRSLRRSWGVCLLVATHVAMLMGFGASNTKLVAPLVAGVASVVVHHAIARRSSAYFAVAALEVLLALHMDFLVPSYLAKEYVVWVLAGAWAVLLLLRDFKLAPLDVKLFGPLGAAFAGLILAHVAFHHPSSAAGLWAFALTAILSAWTPLPAAALRSTAERAWAATLLVVPSWLVFFGQTPFLEEGVEAIAHGWPNLVTVAVILLTGFSAGWFQQQSATAYAAMEKPQPRLFHQTLAWVGAVGGVIQSLALWIGTAVTATVQVAHYGKSLTTGELTLMVLIYGGLALGWFREGQRSERVFPYFLAQAAALALFTAVRRQLMLTTDFWNHQYDVWASLAVSAGLAGARSVLELKSSAARIPFHALVFALPVVAMSWVLIHDLGSNLALVVVGLHSVLFAFLGKDDRESPYSLVAVAGFVGFVILAFWSKLELRVAQAYVIPAGVGILVLLQLLRDRVQPEMRNTIRLVTLAAMIGTSSYYALIDARYPVAFILTLGCLCLAVMGLGGFLRIRLYVFLGFAGLLVDLAAVLYRVLAGMERSPRMTFIGSLVLLVGASLVFGAIYYKTHKEDIDQRIAAWRERLRGWE